MFNTIGNWFRMALYENGELSLTRCLAVGSWLLLAIVSLDLVIAQVNWNEYSTLAS